MRENLESFLFPLILVLITRAFIFQAFKIPSESMRETLLVGDHILVNKAIYYDPIPGLGLSLFPRRLPQRRDILVFKFPDNPTDDYIKRLIGLGGETIRYQRPDVFINGRPLGKEPYAVYHSAGAPYQSSYPAIRLEPGTYFMMGDNRDNSRDSRYWGPLSHELIKGKAFIIYFSWDERFFNRQLARGHPLLAPWYFLRSIRWRRIFQLLE